MTTSIIPSFDFLLNRGNDLTEFFWPILYWVKQQILIHHQIPLWNNLHLAGTPLVSDPQAPIFYPINLLALVMSIDTFFILSFSLHMAIAGIGMYFCSRRGFQFSKKNSFILAFLWALSPKIFAYLEAGHVGLVYSFAWIPFIVLFSLKVKPIHLGIFLALLYYSHLPTFLIVGLASATILIYKREFLPLILTGVFTFGLTAVSLLPQIAWQKESTRYLLLETRDVYPKWNSIVQAIKAVIVPNLDTEKAISIGILPTLLSFLGFLKLRRRGKFVTILATLSVFLLTLNNASPISSFLISQDWYVLLRVSTRFWVVVMFIWLFLVGFALEKYKSKLITTLAILGIVESLLWGIHIFRKPINTNPNLAPQEIYGYLKKDNDLFRVYCTTRCISQKEAVINNLELLDGYSTVQQRNFYEHAWQLTGAYWNYYTLSIPPIGTYTFERPQPDAKSLGEYNVKYVISPYPLTDKGFVKQKVINGFIVYKNELNLTRNYEIYTPNFIRIRKVKQKEPTTFRQVYSSGWISLPDSKSTPAVLQMPNALSLINSNPQTSFVDVKYQPEGFKLGKTITLTTVIVVLIYYLGMLTKSKGIIKKSKVYLLKTVVLLLGVLVGFLVLEFTLRIYYFAHNNQLFGLKPGITTLKFYDNDVYGSALVPSHSGWFVPLTKEYYTWVEVNSHGWPDVEHSFTKPKGINRVLILGDSFVENTQVPLENRFFRKLQTKLGPKYEVIAIGRGNTGTAQQYLILEQYVLKYQPDIVIQMFLEANDVKNNSPLLQKDPYLPYFELDGNGTLVEIPHFKRSERKLARIKEAFKKFRVVELLLSIRHNLLERKSAKDNEYPIDYHVYDLTYSDEYKEAWWVTERLLVESKRKVEKSNARYILVTIPGIEQVEIIKQDNILKQFPKMKSNIDFNKPDKVLNDICFKNKITCFSMLEYYKKNSESDLYNFYEGHWNQMGSDLATQFLLEKIRF